jgi:hypothetical protein
MNEHLHHREIDNMNVCLEHSGQCANIENIKSDIAAKDALNTANHAAQWRAIDGMRRWVISGMGALILGVFLWVLNSFHPVFQVVK